MKNAILSLLSPILFDEDCHANTQPSFAKMQLTKSQQDADFVAKTAFYDPLYAADGARLGTHLACAVHNNQSACDPCIDAYPAACAANAPHRNQHQTR